MKNLALIISLFFTQIAFSNDFKNSSKNHREWVSCDAYITDSTPIPRQIEVGKSTTVIFDSKKNEVLYGETSEVEQQLSKMNIQGFAIVFNLKTWLPNIYEAGLTRVILDNNNNSIIDKRSTYFVRSATSYLLVGIRIDSEDFLIAECRDPSRYQITQSIY